MLNQTSINTKRSRSKSKDISKRSQKRPTLTSGSTEFMDHLETRDCDDCIDRFISRLEANFRTFESTPPPLQHIISLDDLKKTFSFAINFTLKNRHKLEHKEHGTGIRFQRHQHELFRTIQITMDKDGEYALYLCPHRKTIDNTKDDSFLLGEGAYKKVKVAYRIDTPEPQLCASSNISGEEVNIADEVDSEMSYSNLFEHPFIIHYDLGAIYTQEKNGSTKPKATLFSDMGKATLWEVITGEITMSLSQKTTLFEKIVFAVAHMHDKGIIHQDLKPENIILVENSLGTLEPRIIDFGLSTKFTPRKEATGTQGYVSPELLSYYMKSLDNSSTPYYAQDKSSYAMQIFQNEHTYRESSPNIYNDAWSLGEIGLELFNLTPKPYSYLESFTYKFGFTRLVDTFGNRFEKDDKLAHIKHQFPLIYQFLQTDRKDRLLPQQAVALIDKTPLLFSGQPKQHSTLREDFCSSQPREKTIKKRFFN